MRSELSAQAKYQDLLQQQLLQSEVLGERSSSPPGVKKKQKEQPWQMKWKWKTNRCPFVCLCVNNEAELCDATLQLIHQYWSATRSASSSIDRHLSRILCLGYLMTSAVHRHLTFLSLHTNVKPAATSRGGVKPWGNNERRQGSAWNGFVKLLHSCSVKSKNLNLHFFFLI